MDAGNSNLSNAKYGYDFVVSTTQASINSGLLEYLWQSNQPENYVCYLSDPKTGNATIRISLEELLTRTGGVNPFEIPDGTLAEDARIEALTRNNFAVGVKIRIGVPPGKMPKELPLVLELGKNADKAIFRMFCSEFQVILNTPSGGWSSKGSWNVWDQPSGSPWCVETTVDLVNADLDKDLETPYFNQHPELKEKLKSQLESLSNTSFSLQQLLLGLDNAVLHSVPTFVGIPAESHVLAVLQKCFVDIYSKAAKDYGEPIIAVTAVAHGTPDRSQLHMTSFELEVSPYRDINGSVVNNPTPGQVAVTTLNHLCMTGGHRAPGVAETTWNWVQPGDTNNESGVIAINRRVFGEQLLETILPSVRKSCITSKVKIDFTDGIGDWKADLQFFPGQYPQIAAVKGPEHGAWVIDITYSAKADTGVRTNASESWGVFYDSLEVIPNFTCEVSFSGSNITIVQHLWLQMSVTCEGVPQSLIGYDVTITDVYDLSVDQTGRLNITRNAGRHLRVDRSQPAHGSWLENAFSGVNDAVNQIKNNSASIVSLDLESISFTTPQSFVFPGGKVFTYTSATFSKYQDLICNITYAAPTRPFHPAPRTEVPNDDTSREQPATRTGGKPAIKPPGAAAPPSLSMSHTTDLIQNYIQGDIVASTGKFEALQTDDGHSMLFTMNTANVLHVIIEQSGTTKTGWILMDLSSAFLAAKFPGHGSSVRTFDVGQSVTDGTIGMALVVSDGRSDQLFLSLHNSSSDTSWTAKPGWSAVPFDAEDTMGAGSTVTIVHVMFAEPQGNRQHIIVDIDRSSNKAVKDIARYYVDPLKASGKFWTRHGLPIDIEQGNYQSCVGRVADGFVDGVYTLGTAGGSAQLVYVPIENAFGDGPPPPSRLSLPQNAKASAIAAARRPGSLSAPDGTTDLYAVGNSVLYYFPAERQTDMSVGSPLLESNVLSGTTELATMTRDGVTTIWGKNASDEVYYLSCPSSQLGVPGAWSAPVPIVFGVERMSPFLNRSDGGKAIFTSGSGRLQRLTQATDTDAKIWVADEIKLQAAPTAEPLQFKSYTTIVQVINKQRQRAAGVKLSIATRSRTSVYINGIYYVLGQTPVTVATDAVGTVTVVEALQDSINGTLLMVTCNDGEVEATINPMEKSFQSIAALSTKGSLRGAKIPTNTVAGGTRGTATWAALVAENVSPKDVTVVVDSLSKLGTTYDLVKPKPNSTKAVSSGPCMRVIPHTLYLASSSIGSLSHDVAIAAGDLFRWLQSGVESIVHVIKDDVSDAWHFVATIAGKVYRTALNSVDAVVGAVEWVFSAVKTGVKDLISFVEFLFDWDDIERTKNVLCNTTRQWMRGQVKYVQTAKAEFDGQIANAEKNIEKWAGITDWSTSLGSRASQPAAASAANPTAGHTPASQMMMSHFKNHGANLTVVGTPPSVDVAQQVVDDLLAALDKEGQAISAVYSQLKDLAKDFSSMTVGEILKGLAGIIGVAVLSSTQVVVDALLNVLIDFAEDAISFLDTKIHIPVISDILNAIGIPDVSYLDLICWIPAVSYTVIYKIANREAPFPDNADVQALVAANCWETLQALLDPEQSTTPATESFGQDAYHMVQTVPEPSHMFMARQQQPEAHRSKASVTSISSFASVSAASTAPTSPGTIKPVSSDFAKKIYHLGHIVGSDMCLMAVFVGPLEAALPPSNPWSIYSAAIGVVGGSSIAIANFAVPKAPVQSKVFIGLSLLTTSIRLLAKAVFSGPGQTRLRGRIRNFDSPLVAQNSRATGAMIDALLVIPAACVTLEHLFELGSDKPSMDQAAAVVGELSNVSSYVSRVSYCGAVNLPSVDRAEPIEDMTIANMATFVLQFMQAEM